MYYRAISVKPYVKKFILARYQQPYWIINKSERIGKIVYSLLEPMPAKPDRHPLPYGETLNIGICDDYIARQGVYLSNESIAHINEFVHDEIIEQIAMYAHNVKNRTGLKKYKEIYIPPGKGSKLKGHVIQNPQLSAFIEKREIIYDTLKLYDITEDDFPFATVLKGWQRLKLPLLNAS